MLQEFSAFLKNLEDQRELMMTNITETLMKPLEKFRKEQLGSAKAERKKYEKETEKYYTSLEKLLNMSAKKKEPQLQEADVAVETMRQHFQEESLEYVCKLQEIQERKKFECVEPMLAFFQTVFTFYHQGFELANDFDHYKRALQINIQNGENESVTLKSCVRKTTDTLDRRFCLDIEITDRPGIVLTVQALSEDDHRFWMQAMGGKEPAQFLLKTYSKEKGCDAQLDDIGVNFVRNSISAVEARGINDQGLYRVVGVSSKVQKLLSLMIDENTEVDLTTCEDWDVKTITSALKQYLRRLPEPLMTYALYKEFIVPAKCASPESRVQAIHCLVHRLPEKNREVLSLVTKHLANVAAHNKQNLMTVANLGVVFGPTLMRPQEETVAAIMDLKFQNIVVEILIEQHEKIFGDAPSACPSSTLSPFTAPTRQSKKQARQSRPLAVYNPLDINSVAPSSEDVSLTPDEASLGSNESVSSQSSTASTSETPPEKTKNPHSNTAAVPQNSGVETGMASWMNSTPTCLTSQTKAAKTGAAAAAIASGGNSDKSTESVTLMKAKAVYPCEAEHDSELSFQVGAIFHAVTPSREPGWLEGELEGKRGLIPQNYVEILQQMD
ncbi:hypothetical protein HF521_008959 [Silurus meridionalis]|uniref:Rho GTPase-activating protein 10 n=1 Tax=Silurus meridionalis TaxID=175797 RepID=A0A8T0BX84_SILME|nr:hypothetical protein HF521_008959 [Silurus meridionalis]